MGSTLRIWASSSRSAVVQQPRAPQAPRAPRAPQAPRAPRARAQRRSEGYNIRLALLSLVVLIVWRSCSGNLGSENNEHQKQQAAATLLRALVSNDEVIPVVVICHSRVEVFRESLASLLGDVRGLDSRKVLVAQDGTNSEVAAVARDEFGLALVQRNREQDAITPQGNWGRERGAGAHIAAQYRFAIDAGFAHFANAPALILAEDDLVYSPDFAEFLTRGAALVAEDESLWIASAWNDNGYRGVARDLRRVLRTDFFPGLGWTMQRSLWRQELRLAWPTDHYDWHLRKAEVAKGRECLYPEVARVAHRGWEGSFMDFTHHVRHFAGIVHAQDARYRWCDDDVSVGREDVYDAALALTLAHRAWHVRHGEDLLSALTWIPGAVLVIWHRSSLDPRMNFRFRPLARRLGIWEDPRRGARRGVHELWFRNARVILMNVFDVQEKTQKVQDRRGPQGRPMPPMASRAPLAGARWLARLGPDVGVRIFASGREIANEMDESSLGPPFRNSGQMCETPEPQSRRRRP